MDIWSPFRRSAVRRHAFPEYSSLGRPPAARRLSGKLLRLATLLGGIVACLAYATATRYASIFTRDAAVLGAMGACAPLLFAALLMHAATMCSEGPPELGEDSSTRKGIGFKRQVSASSCEM